MRVNTKQAIYLAALLHDIGKFWQRSVGSRKALKSSTLDMTDSICPKNYKSGYASHIHALFTSEFFENHCDVFPSEFEHEGKTHQIGFLSARHHKKQLDTLERIIQFADILSSGHDRREMAEDDDHSNEPVYKYKKTPLLNPFDQVYSIRDRNEQSYYPLTPLKIDGRIFSSREVDLNEDKSEQYQKLWSAFEQEVSHLPIQDFSNQANTLLQLLRKYTWCIPSATNTMPDISLYDHLKTTAAIAACLHESEASNNFGPIPSSFDGLKTEEEQRFALMVCDFSGIQNFIYQLSSKGAAKTLKGRSFYLNLIQDAVIAEIKYIFDVEDAHVLMAAGGTFQILLPNINSKIQQVESFIADVNRQLRSDYAGAIYLAHGITTFAARSFLIKDLKNEDADADKELGFTGVVDAAYEIVQQDKDRKYADIIDVDFFKPGPTVGTKASQMCHVTGIDLQEHEIKTLDDEDGLYVSNKVYDQINLGKYLKETDYIVKMRDVHLGRSKKGFFKPLDNGITELNISYKIATEENLESVIKEYKSNIDEIIAINNSEFLNSNGRDANYGASYMFYGGGWTPEDVLEEEEIESQNQEGIHYPRRVEFTDIAYDGVNNLMGVLRLDVDNLGKLFTDGFKVSDGIGQSMASISRFSNMSEKLDLFFSGYVHHLVSEVYSTTEALDDSFYIDDFRNGKPNNHILPVYAGGDDVFILCRWDLAPQIAQRISDDFKKFTNLHSKMSLSGGVSMVHGKYPIHKAASEAEVYEKRAKTLPTIDLKADGKDAFCLFGQAMSWDDYKVAKDFVKQIIEWQEQMGTKSLLGFFRILYGEYHNSHHFGRWRWRSAYRLKRTADRYKSKIDAEDLLQLAGWLYADSFNDKKLNRIEQLESDVDRKPGIVDLTGLTTKWMQLLTRNK